MTIKYYSYYNIIKLLLKYNLKNISKFLILNFLLLIDICLLIIRISMFKIESVNFLFV